MPSEIIWADLLNATAEEKQFVERLLKIRIPSEDSLSEIEASSRLILDHGTLYLSSPAVRHNEENEAEITPVGFLIGPHVLVTVRFAQLPTFDDVGKRIGSDDSLENGMVGLWEESIASNALALEIQPDYYHASDFTVYAHLQLAQDAKADAMIKKSLATADRGDRPINFVNFTAKAAMVNDAERSGRLKPGGVIVEGTAGNVGIGIALVANARGYRSVIVMPDTQSQEKKDMLRLCGADLRLVPAVPYSNPGHYARYSGQLAEELGAFWANQFDNTANREGHYRTTGPEIWQQTGGKIDGFTCAVGSGGTLGGVARALKERNPAVRIALSDPMRGAQRERDGRGTGDRRERAPAQAERQDERADTIGADPAVAHGDIDEAAIKAGLGV